MTVQAGDVLLYKPKGYLTTYKDPEGRPTVYDLLSGVKDFVFPVGRLDQDTTGLLILTNDSAFGEHISSPESKVPKTYLVKANGMLTPEQEEQFRRGIPLHGRRTAPAGLKRIREGRNPWYEVRLVEGRHNQIRIMFKHFDRLVEKLKRVKIGFLEVGELKPGAYRTLTRTEVERFQKLLQLP